MLGSPIEALPAPAALVDLDVLERNIAEDGGPARASRGRLRPQPRPTSAPRSAGCSGAAGALGACRWGQGRRAEVFADAGFDDLLVAFPVVGEDKGAASWPLADRARLASGWTAPRVP